MDFSSIKFPASCTRKLHPIMFSDRNAEYVDDFAISRDFHTEIKRVRIMVGVTMRSKSHEEIALKVIRLGLSTRRKIEETRT